MHTELIFVEQCQLCRKEFRSKPEDFYLERRSGRFQTYEGGIRLSRIPDLTDKLVYELCGKCFEKYEVRWTALVSEVHDAIQASGRVEVA